MLCNFVLLKDSFMQSIVQSFGRLSFSEVKSNSSIFDMSNAEIKSNSSTFVVSNLLYGGEIVGTNFMG